MIDFYTIEQLASRVGEKKRKLRYWMQACELEEKRIPGQKAYYSQETLDRLRFIKRIFDLEYEPSKGRFKPTLPQIKDFLEKLTMAQIRDVLSGKEPLEIGYVAMRGSGRATIETLKGDALPMGTKRYGDIIPGSDVPDFMISKLRETKDTESALDYIRQVISAPPKPKPRQEWRTLKLGRDLELRHRSKLTPQQEQQLKLTGKLIQSILGKEK